MSCDHEMPLCHQQNAPGATGGTTDTRHQAERCSRYLGPYPCPTRLGLMNKRGERGRVCCHQQKPPAPNKIEQFIRLSQTSSSGVHTTLPGSTNLASQPSVELSIPPQCPDNHRMNQIHDAFAIRHFGAPPPVTQPPAATNHITNMNLSAMGIEALTATERT